MKSKTLGPTLKQARQSLGLSQHELASLLRVRASHVGYLEQGRRRPSLSLLKRLANTLGLDKEQLFLLSHPEAEELIGDRAEKHANSKKNAWQQLVADKALLVHNRVTPSELKVLSHVALLGSVSKPRDYLFILNCIRQAVRE